jgi:hypothetical protein
MSTWITARLNEPSTWYGLGVVLAGAASHFVPAEWTSVLAGIQYVLGGAAVVTPNK